MDALEDLRWYLQDYLARADPAYDSVAIQGTPDPAGVPNAADPSTPDAFIPPPPTSSRSQSEDLRARQLGQGY